MKKYEYKFIEVPKKSGIKGHGSTFTECQNIIMEEAQNGWQSETSGSSI